MGEKINNLKSGLKRAAAYARCQAGLHFYSAWRLVRSEEMLVENYQRRRCNRCRYCQKRSVV